MSELVSSGLPVAEVVVNPDSRPYWDAAAEGRLLLPRCRRCGSVIWYPRHFCPDCGSLDVDWFEASGAGTVYSFATIHQADPAYATSAPYVIAYVELEEGPRVLTNLLGGDGWAVGDRVRAVFDRRPDGGLPLLRFVRSG